MTWTDPIVEEIHQIRQKLLADVGGDFSKYMAQVRANQAASGRGVVTLEPRRTRAIGDYDQRGNMEADTEIRAAGIQALVAALGLVDAERFVASLSRERIDFTEWRRTNLPKTSVTEPSKNASRATKKT